MNKVIGYARISSGKGSQILDPQVSKLQESGCDQIFSETISTRKAEKERPELMKCLSSLRKGDTLKLCTLSRLGRTQTEVIQRLNDLQAEGINVITLDGLVNLEALGKFAPVLIGLLTGLNQVEREQISERVQMSVDYRRENNFRLVADQKQVRKRKLVLRLRMKAKVIEKSGSKLVRIATIRRGIADNEKVEVGKMKEDRLEKELLESGRFNDKFSKVFGKWSKNFTRNLSWLYVPRWRKIRGLDKDDPVENKGQMQSSFKEFEDKING